MIDRNAAASPTPGFWWVRDAGGDEPHIVKIDANGFVYYIGSEEFSTLAEFLNYSPLIIARIEPPDIGMVEEEKP